MHTIPKSEQTRSRILSTGHRLVLGTGFTGMGLKELLNESAVPKGSFYHYFASKEAFGQALLEDYVADYLGRVDRLVAAPLSGGERLMAYCGAWLAAADKPSIAETCLVVKLASEISDLSEDMRTTLDAGVAELVLRLEQIIVAGIADGSIAPQSDTTRAARVLYAQWLGAAILSKLGKSERPLIEAMDDTRQRFLT